MTHLDDLWPGDAAHVVWRMTGAVTGVCAVDGIVLGRKRNVVFGTKDKGFYLRMYRPGMNKSAAFRVPLPVVSIEITAVGGAHAYAMHDVEPEAHDAYERVMEMEASP